MLQINNPGNIRNSPTTYVGEITPSRHKSFKTFENMFFGYRAMFRLLNTYIIQHKIETLEKMIERYAPPFENQTDKYIDFVSTRSGIGKNEILYPNDKRLIPIVYQMAIMENGIKAMNDYEKTNNISNLRQVEIGYQLINIKSVEEGMTIIRENNHPD